MNVNETKITDLKNAYESIFKTQTELKDIIHLTILFVLFMLNVINASKDTHFN